MRTWLLTLASLLALSVAGVACSSGDDDDEISDDDDDDDDDGASLVDFTVNGTGMAPHEGYTASVRVLRTSGVPAVVYCDSSAQIVGGAFTLGAVDLLEVGQTYTAEMFANLDDDTTHTYTTSPDSPDDHEWAIPIGTVTTAVTINQGHTAFSDITWVSGTNCPGE